MTSSYSYHPKGFWVMLWILCGCSQWPRSNQ